MANLSRQMRMAVRLYEKGDDTSALDHFMEVLTRGDPAERNMANEYINLITKRMNTGEKDTAPLRPSSVRPAETVVEPAKPDAASAPAAPPASKGPAAPDVVIEKGGGERVAAAVPLPGSLRPAAPAPELSPAAKSYPTAPAVESELPKSNKALMKKEIRSKIRNMVEDSLKELKSFEDIRLLMREDGDPEAIGIPTPLLFQNGIAFQKDAQKILEALTRLTYGLGTAQVVILPEGTALGDAKVLDMRRTMGVSSYLYSAGVAPARVRINLLNSQVDLPKPMLEFKGVVILFVYNQPMTLVVESSLGEESGPPLSLGIFPGSVRPDRGEGSIIEFSVEDPPAGLVSWKFQLLQPAASDGKDLAPLQEVLGGSPVFHQIYWNGRQNYFGPPLPAGRYECVLTAIDAKNRQRTLHRWIQLVNDDSLAQQPEKLLAKAAETATPSQGAFPAAAQQVPPPVAAVTIVPAPAGAPSADLSARTDALIKEKTGGKARRKTRIKGKAEPAAEPTPAAAAEPAPGTKPSRPTASGYSLDFGRNTHQLTPDA